MLKFEENAFNGLVVDKDRLPLDEADFTAALESLLQYRDSAGKLVIWLTLPIGLGHYVGICTSRGFVFHTCLHNEITLIHKSKPEDIAPHIATHSLGAGGFVTNQSGQLLVIQERGASTYKLPGGHIELGEKIEDAVIREVYEETGVRCQFNCIVAMATTHPYQFGKSNIYYVCKLTPVNLNIQILDSDEIADAKWIDPQIFLSDDKNSQFNRYLVSSLLDTKGLGKSALDVNQLSHRKHEIFIAS